MASSPWNGSVEKAIQPVLEDFQKGFGLRIRLWDLDGAEARTCVFAAGDEPDDPVIRRISLRDGPCLELHVAGAGAFTEGCADVLEASIERTHEDALSVRFFTHELSERYEEINLLYSISETLGLSLEIDEAAREILREVCELLGARRGSLWVFDDGEKLLHLRASVGESGLKGPLAVDDPEAITSRVFREGEPVNEGLTEAGVVGVSGSRLSVPIRYTPTAGEPVTVGVINLFGSRRGGSFTRGDQRLLTAIATQVGAALENHRLLMQSLQQQRVSHEMELAHDLQMKLLPAVEKFSGAEVAARVEPAESVGGDFYHLFHLPEGRIGVMIGDVSGHGFPAALIMALSMSAATIYASEFGEPAKVLRHIDDALREEFENTEVYLSLFYGVVDPRGGSITYSNAGHPHAFRILPEGVAERLLATDPPVGIAGPEAYGQRSVEWTAGADILFLFTDGLSDFLTSEVTGKGEDFVLAEVTARAGETPQRIVDALFASMENVVPSIPSDDRTALVVRV